MALRLLRKAALFIVLAAAAHGCAMGAQYPGSPTTQSVSPRATSGDNTDAEFILAVLSRARADGQGGEWENPMSGARGRITAVNRHKPGEEGCLAFATTRQSFDGINLYRGLACEDAVGVLQLRAFAML